MCIFSTSENSKQKVMCPSQLQLSTWHSPESSNKISAERFLCEEFSWFMIDMGSLSPLWAVSSLGKWAWITLKARWAEVQRDSKQCPPVFLVLAPAWIPALSSLSDGWQLVSWKKSFPPYLIIVFIPKTGNQARVSCSTSYTVSPHLWHLDYFNL